MVIIPSHVQYDIYIAGILAHLHTIDIASLSQGPDVFQGVGQGAVIQVMLRTQGTICM